MTNLKIETHIDNTAVKFFRHASTFSITQNGDPWLFWLIPHDAVMQTSSFEYFVHHFVAWDQA